MSIVGKGHLIDHLKMSATPIPRTLAISILGESDISVIRTLPGCKKEPITKYLGYRDMPEVYAHLRTMIAKGQQAYVICPMIEESEVMDLQNATEVYEKFKVDFQGFCEIGLIHSKLKPGDKERVMNDFAQNKIRSSFPRASSKSASTSSTPRPSSSWTRIVSASLSSTRCAAGCAAATSRRIASS